MRCKTAKSDWFYDCTLGLLAFRKHVKRGLVVSLAGYPVRLMVNTHNFDGKHDNLLTTLYQQEMFKNQQL